ncbi:peroxiredoxin-like family protein [Novosphingobium aquiterrae]|uniref:Peroxiredoxin-like family protein n=1 Tax=Novosphingobium aquiterrae TaxID=624388 RepID=A0ABV6PEL6_9SPHN
MSDEIRPDPSDIVARLSRRPLALGERLSEIARDARTRDPQGSALVDRFVARLEAARAGSDAPQIGEMLPSFILPDHDGKLRSSQDLLAAGPLVVVFHRGHWCPYCRMTIATLAEAQHRIGRSRVVAISAETQRFTRRIRAETGAQFLFLSDMNADYASAIGLAITVDPALIERYERAGKRIPDFQGSKGWILPIPAVFVIDRDGVIHASHIDPDYRRRMEVEELMRAAAALGN